ncbi:hypothetical protein [Corallibacter sp.]|uniref:hypothetical protein n=1 Tax=Corallibacter sp. TaxID=2038084 RepID=UPI003AB8319E
MKKELKNGIIIKQDLKGNFIQTPKSILINPKLTDSAKILLQLLGDIKPNTKISLTYYRELLGWSKNKLNSASKNLKENGFLKVVKHPNGKDNGFTYVYTISEYGNLKPETDNEIITVKNTGKPHSKRKIKTSNNSSEETKPILPQNNYNALTNAYLVNLPVEFVEEKIEEIMKIKEQENEFQNFKKLIDKLLNDFKIDCYNFCISNTNNLNGEVKRIQNAYTDWLKGEIFDNNNFSLDFNKKWLHLKLQLKNRKTDFETALLRD